MTTSELFDEGLLPISSIAEIVVAGEKLLLKMAGELEEISKLQEFCNTKVRRLGTDTTPPVGGGEYICRGCHTKACMRANATHMAAWALMAAPAPLTLQRYM